MCGKHITPGTSFLSAHPSAQRARAIIPLMRFWNKWPYWLRGGGIAVGIVLLSYVLGLSCLYLLTSTGSWGLECLLFATPWIPFWFVHELFSLSTTNYGILVTAVWFIMGSLIGALWNYIKNTHYIHWPHWLQITVIISLLMCVATIFVLFASYLVPVKSGGLIDDKGIIIFQ